MPLVVVLTHNSVVTVLADRKIKSSVSGYWPLYVDAICLSVFDGRPDFFNFLRSKKSILSSVWV